MTRNSRDQGSKMKGKRTDATNITNKKGQLKKKRKGGLLSCRGRDPEGEQKRSRETDDFAKAAAAVRNVRPVTHAPLFRYLYSFFFLFRLVLHPLLLFPPALTRSPLTKRHTQRQSTREEDVASEV